MTTLKSGDLARYDAWNRLVEVDDSSGNPIEKYTYDGTNRRIQVYSEYSDGTPTKLEDDYLSGQQVVESDLATGSDVTTSATPAGGYQYVWSPRYIDAPVLRDTLLTNRSGIVAADRVFYVGDANYNVTGLVNASGQVVERYAYTPYGQVTYYHGNDQPGTYADWSPAGSSSAYGNTRLFAGMHFNPATGLYDDRARPYDPALERFIGRDPALADENLYRYCGDGPANMRDPSGLASVKYVPGRGQFENLTFGIHKRLGELGADMTMTWAPNQKAFLGPGGKKKCCEVGFIQVVSYTWNKSGWYGALVDILHPSRGWHVDYGVPYPYGARYPNRADPLVEQGKISMQDFPSADAGGGYWYTSWATDYYGFQAETAAVALTGPEGIHVSHLHPQGLNRPHASITVYGVVKWSFAYARRDDGGYNVSYSLSVPYRKTSDDPMMPNLVQVGSSPGSAPDQNFGHSISASDLGEFDAG